MAAFTAFMFMLDRVRSFMLALALVVLLKAAWLIVLPSLFGV